MLLEVSVNRRNSLWSKNALLALSAIKRHIENGADSLTDAEFLAL